MVLVTRDPPTSQPPPMPIPHLVATSTTSERSSQISHNPRTTRARIKVPRKPLKLRVHSSRSEPLDLAIVHHVNDHLTLQFPADATWTADSEGSALEMQEGGAVVGDVDVGTAEEHGIEVFSLKISDCEVDAAGWLLVKIRERKARFTHADIVVDYSRKVFVRLMVVFLISLLLV